MSNEEKYLIDDHLKALEFICNYKGLILLDLDETLYLGNSTQDYINEARPAILAKLILSAVDFLKPWRLTGKETADNWRVIIITLLFPWVIYFWQKKCKNYSKGMTNILIKDCLDERSDVIIATLGFKHIVTPLIKSMGFAEHQIICCRALAFEDRVKGKLWLIQEALGEDKIKDAMLVSDSSDDAPTFERVAHPLHVKWPTAKYRKAFSYSYYPLSYLHHVKRPRTTAVKDLFLQDMATWVLCTVPFVSHNLFLPVSVFLIFMSTWCVYEYGYIENDLFAEKYENDPKLTEEYFGFNFKSVSIKPWLYSLFFGLLGIYTYNKFLISDALVQQVVAWIIFLLSLTGLYRLYNSVNKSTRIWLYLPLMLFRFCALVVIFPVSILGLLFCGSMAVARWFSYISYRLFKVEGKYEWPKIPIKLIRVLIAASFFVLFLFRKEGNAGLVTLYDIPLVLYQVLLAQKEIRGILAKAKFLKRK